MDHPTHLFSREILMTNYDLTLRRVLCLFALVFSNYFLLRVFSACVLTWSKKNYFFTRICIIAFYGTEQCACNILVISIFQNICYDQFEILYIVSLKK